jgi:hypothetical protein
MNRAMKRGLFMPQWGWGSDAEDKHYKIEIPMAEPTRPVRCLHCDRALRDSIEFAAGQCFECIGFDVA